jgi:D-tyrosyl-tRNA(Tyr) deacylase
MRVLLQRVSHASVTVDKQIVGQIEQGLLILLGIGEGDTEIQVKTLVEKIIHLRIFEDAEGKMNRSLLDIGGHALVVSQFTLYADTRRGRRPSFIRAAHPTVAEPLFEQFKAKMVQYGIPTASGIFGASMDIQLCNRGPVTIWLDSEEI